MAENQRLTRQFLQMLASAGVTHIPTVQLRPEGAPARASGVQRRKSARPAKPAAAVSQPRRSAENLRPGSATPPPQLEETTAILSVKPQTEADRAAVLCRLSEVVAKCTRCAELADFRTQTVFGVGNPCAEIMFIGEAPGADEDRQGEPFVGAAGQLLNRIITATGLKREELYICNVLKCRPPGNRNPKPQEAANCREFLDAQIQIIQPRYIVCWGTVAAQNLLRETQSVGRLRGRFHKYGDARVLCTYHPSYLLRTPSAKKAVWEDMKLLRKELGLEG